MKFPSTNELLSSNNDEIQLEPRNNVKSEITNSRNFYQKATNLDSLVPQNVEFDELNRKEAEINLIHNPNEQWQPEKEQKFTDRISTTPLSHSNSSQLLKFCLMREN